MRLPWSVIFDSPPRVRGAQAFAVSCRNGGRLTPACAGSTHREYRRGPRAATHPRVCGEHIPPCGIVMFTADSPPRVRGARRHRRWACSIRRLTPACAGSTGRTPAPRSSQTTHPRVCGEHPMLEAFDLTGSFSPPRVRGAPRPDRSHATSTRLTPACAGSTAVVPRSRAGWATHPRVCGEHPGRTARTPPAPDSPPRVRGARLAHASHDHAVRLTPACAGSTVIFDLPPSGQSTHPRVCGEHPGARARRRRGRRLTPACAGSTADSRIGSLCRSTHPRVCGEHLWYALNERLVNDSPPRVRGALELLAEGRRELRTHPRVCGEHTRYAQFIGRVDRLTPACAGSTTAARCRTPTTTTHPRVCGEHLKCAFMATAVNDSPPRVRGALDRALGETESGRLTPACAGSTTSEPHSSASPSTHPRVCGEHAAGSSPPWRYSDSPPRVRGARFLAVADPHHVRLTPACAGSTPSCRGCILRPSTHPRVCGEHSRGKLRSHCPIDSPPRVRGARWRRRIRRSVLRLTPACAGSTRAAQLRLALGSTHPRVCGEHNGSSWTGRLMYDSPPRVRGARQAVSLEARVRRLTPACAGSTHCRPGHEDASTTHPRVCGEHGYSYTLRSRLVDSPPRVRGAPNIVAVANAVDRLTPACAGSTPQRGEPQLGEPTHPRVCGEHVVMAMTIRRHPDSPPRVRGAPDGGLGLLPHHRLTPACAGSTSHRTARLGPPTTHPRVCGEHPT